ncbi:hypothetical protein [Campylobacter hyointestinalis]|uniref:hypothetical protein n=1 Tax=Campylobacter hyointestinalis TaxID=198 RepID=UPI000DCB451F|nr:hypothetical protein [Campylobacter hyointestinalis]RAZ51541.1 hypothetical protein CHL10075_06535 [Campylobacter hyointestinalis subsp. lawsonii]
MIWRENELIEVGHNKLATQSSISSLSRDNDPFRCLDDFTVRQNLPYSTHTANEDNPWWCVDLENIYKLELISISTTMNIKEILPDLSFWVSADGGGEWTKLDNDLVRLNGDRIDIYVSQRICVRYFKISYNKFGALHFKSIKLFIAKHKGMIIQTRMDGFGARLFAMLNAMYLANISGYKLGLYWHKIDNGDDGVLVESENDMFDEVFVKECSVTNADRDYIYGLGADINLKDFIEGKYGRLVGWFLPKRLDTICKDINAKDYYEYVKYAWDNMPFNIKYKEIINKIKYLDIFNGENFKAIHIRNGDNILSLPHRKVIFNSICQSRILPIEIVINYINNNFDKNENIVLFGPDFNSLNAIKEYLINLGYINVHISNDILKDAFGYLDKMSMTIADFALLLKSSNIYCGDSSLFIHLATLINNNCKVVNILKYFNIHEIYEYITTSPLIPNINPLQKAGSLSYIFAKSKELNLDMNDQIDILTKASFHDSENFAYPIMIVIVLLRFNCFKEANDLLKRYIDDSYEQIINIAFVKYPAETRVSLARTPLEYIELFNILSTSDIKSYEYLSFLYAHFLRYQKDYEGAKNICKTLEGQKNINKTIFNNFCSSL